MGEGTFFDQQEIQVVRACLRLSLDFMSDPLALEAMLSAFGWLSQAVRHLLMGDEPALLAEHIFDGERIRQLKPQDQQAVIRVQEQLYGLNDHQADTPAALITFVMKDEGLGYGRALAAKPDGPAQIERVRELLRLARPFDTIGNFLDELDTMRGDDPLSLFAVQRVTLSTIHAFKGLERKLVFLTGFEDGYFPSGSAQASPQEDLRLAYVGFTRATQALCVSFAQTRDGCNRQSSAWLRGLPMEMRQRPDWVQAAVKLRAAAKLQTAGRSGTPSDGGATVCDAIGVNVPE
jgi:superfamily I DNA/RNA helicase